MATPQRAEHRPVVPGEPGSSRRLKAAICDAATSLCVQHQGNRLRALVLTGSLARDEATFLRDGERWRLLGDTEFLLIHHDGVMWPSDGQLRALGHEVEARLAQCGILGHVTLCGVPPRYLRRLPPHIFAFELRACGQVVWGDSEVLSLVPAFFPADIPLEDAWRLLCNRMIEQLEVRTGAVEPARPLPSGVGYRTVKLYLDMATSLLVFAGAYAPTYRERQARLQVLADRAGSSDGWPFPLKRFADDVAACARWKLAGIVEADGPEASLHQRAVTYAWLLWRWELARLTGTTEQVGDRTLLERWMLRQPVAERLRGWAYVLRRLGWHRSWRYWPRWARRAWRASPRYWVYAAASELFFQLPDLVDAEAPPRDWEVLRGVLPAVAPLDAGTQRVGWRQLAADVVWNYNQFLVGTRA